MHFSLFDTNGIHVNAKNGRLTAEGSRCRQIRKFENSVSLFGRLRPKIAPKSVPHVQHDYFSSFSQWNHWFVALSLSLSSSFLELKLRTDDGDGKEDRWEFAYLMSRDNVYCTRCTPRTCASFHFDTFDWRHLWNNDVKFEILQKASAHEA